jgi:uncharacterized membrane protein YbjE (DUF340 family)
VTKLFARIESVVALAVLLAAVAFSLAMGWYARSPVVTGDAGGTGQVKP